MKAKRPCIKCLARVLHPFHDNGQVHTNYIAEFVRLSGDLDERRNLAKS